MTLAHRLEAFWLDPERRARAFIRLWWASVAMLAFGYIVIAQHYWGRLPQFLP